MPGLQIVCLRQTSLAMGVSRKHKHHTLSNQLGNDSGHKYFLQHHHIPALLPPELRSVRNEGPFSVQTWIMFIKCINNLKSHEITGTFFDIFTKCQPCPTRSDWKITQDCHLVVHKWSEWSLANNKWLILYQNKPPIIQSAAMTTLSVTIPYR